VRKSSAFLPSSHAASSPLRPAGAHITGAGLLPRRHPLPLLLVSGAPAFGGSVFFHGLRATVDGARFAPRQHDLGLNGALGLAGWQWLLILEAIPAMLLGFITLATMTDRSEQVNWLADDERTWLVSTMNAERAGNAATETVGVWRALADPRALGSALVYFGTSDGIYTLGDGPRRSSGASVCPPLSSVF
jgi:hypothetical protein